MQCSSLYQVTRCLSKPWIREKKSKSTLRLPSLLSNKNQNYYRGVVSKPSKSSTQMQLERLFGPLQAKKISLKLK